MTLRSRFVAALAIGIPGAFLLLSPQRPIVRAQEDLSSLAPITMLAVGFAVSPALVDLPEVDEVTCGSPFVPKPRVATSSCP